MGGASVMGVWGVVGRDSRWMGDVGGRMLMGAMDGGAVGGTGRARGDAGARGRGSRRWA